MTDKPAREWWIRLPTLVVNALSPEQYAAFRHDAIKVIEYSAYEAACNERDELQAALEQNLMNNDEMGCEFVYVNTLKDMLAKEQARGERLVEWVKRIRNAALGGDETTTELECHHLAEEAIAAYEAKGEL